MKKLILAAGAAVLTSTVGAAPLFAQDMGKDKFIASESETMVWPACRPGPGDDRCIQVYERGVKQAYDQWAARGSDTAMGGPEEPLDTAAAVNAEMSMGSSLIAKDPSLQMSVSAGGSDTADKWAKPEMMHPQMSGMPDDAKLKPMVDKLSAGKWDAKGGMDKVAEKATTDKFAKAKFGTDKSGKLA